MTRHSGLCNTYHTLCNSIGAYDMVQDNVPLRASFKIFCWFMGNEFVCEKMSRMVHHIFQILSLTIEQSVGVVYWTSTALYSHCLNMCLAIRNLIEKVMYGAHPANNSIV